MFGHFAFGAESQPLRDDDHDGDAPSPMDTSYARISPPPPPIPQQQSPLNHYSAFQPSLPPLHGDELRLLQSSQPIIPAVDEGQEDEEMDLAVAASSSPGQDLGSNRVQRQVKMRLKRRKAQVRDLNALVEQMAISNPQCTMQDSAPTTQPVPSPPIEPSDHVEGPAESSELVADTRERHMLRASPEEDDGFAELEKWAMEQGVMLKRASTPSGFRKVGMLRYKTAETMGNQAKKVRSVPRMRKRRPPRNPT